MLGLSSIDRAIVRRSRALHGLQAAGVAFVLAAGSVFALAVASRVAGFRLGLSLAIMSALLPVMALVCGYALGRSRKPDVPRLLLSIDLALATGERLCSLHELRLKGGSSVFQTRIEKELLEHPPEWRRVMRVRWTNVVPWAAGCVALVLAALFLLGPPSQAVATAYGEGERARVGGRGDDRSAATDDAGRENPVVAWEGPAANEPRRNAPQELVEVLSAPPVRGVLGDLADEDGGPSGGSAPEADWRDAVSDFVSELGKRLRGESEASWSLTEQERSALRDLLGSVQDPGVREALSSLLNADSAEGVEEGLSELERLLDELGSPSEGESLPRDPRDVPPADVSPSDSDIVTSGLSSEEGYLGREVGRLADDGPTDGAPMQDSRPDGADGASSEGLVLPQDEDDPSDRGAEGELMAAELEGAPPGQRSDIAHRSGSEMGGTGVGDRVPAEHRTPPAGARFTPEEILANWGDEGDVRRFLTRGAPFETPPQGQGGAPALSVDYEMLRALLEARALAPDVQSLVRTYFERITQGGP